MRNGVSRRLPSLAAHSGSPRITAGCMAGRWICAATPRRITELLHYHAELIDVALKLAFPRYHSPKLERRRLALTGLGTPAVVLREAEFALRLWIEELPEG